MITKSGSKRSKFPPHLVQRQLDRGPRVLHGRMLRPTPLPYGLLQHAVRQVGEGGCGARQVVVFVDVGRVDHRPVVLRRTEELESCLHRVVHSRKQPPILKDSDRQVGGTHEPERVEVMVQRVSNQAHHTARSALVLPTFNLG